jgi:hypothetical protein
MTLNEGGKKLLSDKSERMMFGILWEGRIIWMKIVERIKKVSINKQRINGNRYNRQRNYSTNGKVKEETVEFNKSIIKSYKDDLQNVGIKYREMNKTMDKHQNHPTIVEVGKEVEIKVDKEGRVERCIEVKSINISSSPRPIEVLEREITKLDTGMKGEKGPRIVYKRYMSKNEYKKQNALEKNKSLKEEEAKELIEIERIKVFFIVLFIIWTYLLIWGMIDVKGWVKLYYEIDIDKYHRREMTREQREEDKKFKEVIEVLKRIYSIVIIIYKYKSIVWGYANLQVWLYYFFRRMNKKFENYKIIRVIIHFLIIDLIVSPINLMLNLYYIIRYWKDIVRRR